MVDPNSVLVFDLRSLASFPVPLRSRVKALGVKASAGVWVLPLQVQGLAFVFGFRIRLLHWVWTMPYHFKSKPEHRL